MGLFDAVKDEIKDNLNKGGKEEIKNRVNEESKNEDVEVAFIVNTQRDPLNCRKGPGVNHPVLGVFPKGSKVVLIEKTNNEWYKVTNGTLTGYASAEYLKEV